MSVWADVIGQSAAIERLRRAAADPVHAYLFVGPSGVGSGRAARAFAAELITGGADTAAAGAPAPGRDVDLVLRGEHPDVTEVMRAGASISAEQAREIVRTASLAPVEGERKVMILHEFHLLRPEGAAILLKTLEEPPPSTVFIVLADFIPHDLITISSRCARIDFRSVSDDEIIDMLRADGIDGQRAGTIAAAAHGNVDRARLLAHDEALASRRAAFAAVAAQVDGTGATASRLTSELLELIDAAGEAIAARHADEIAELDARIKQYGERGSGKKRLDERHKREVRRHRTDELLAGFAVIAGSYRDALASGELADVEAGAAAVTRIHSAMEAFDYNPNETLLLQSLLWDLPIT